MTSLKIDFNTEKYSPNIGIIEVSLDLSIGNIG